MKHLAVYSLVRLSVFVVLFLLTSVDKMTNKNSTQIIHIISIS